MNYSYSTSVNDKMIRLQQLRSALSFLTSRVVRFDDKTYSELYKNLNAEIAVEERYLRSWAEAKAANQI